MSSKYCLILMYVTLFRINVWYLFVWQKSVIFKRVKSVCFWWIFEKIYVDDILILPLVFDRSNCNNPASIKQELPSCKQSNISQSLSGIRSSDSWTCQGNSLEIWNLCSINETIIWELLYLNSGERYSSKRLLW